MTREPTGLYRGPDAAHESLVIGQVVPREEHRSEHFSSFEEMMEVSPAMYGASWTGTIGIKRGWIVGEAGVSQVVNAMLGVSASGSAGTGGDHAVKHVNATFNGSQDI